MLGTFILTTAYSVLDWIISLFPVSTGFPSSVSTAMQGLGGYISILNPLVPFDILAWCVGLAFTIELAVFGFKTVKWIISHIPAIGGRG